ncbi:MAG: hypothetical protein DRQ47_06525 [Gammaproteobacteria bacterium]|nr:MAG: hypothetical protein DRQ47_06525 [Gammaproteobacteria bacterium]
MMTILASKDVVNGLLQFKGPDAEKFLQGQLTCDMNDLSSQQSLPGAYCSPQGRIRANFIIFKASDETFLMVLPKQQIPFLIEVLAPYVAFFKCDLSDESNHWHLLGILSSETAANVETSTIINPEIDDLLKQTSKPWQLARLDNISCIRLPGATGRWLCFSTENIHATLSEIQTLAPQQWQAEEIKSGLVWIDEQNRDKFLPHDLSLPALGAVSFTKGCYTGQEIVARMQYRGEPKYLLAVLTTVPTDNELPERLVQTVDNSKDLKVGEIVNAIHLDDNRWLLSASVKRALPDQQKFQLKLGERAILCHIQVPVVLTENNNL